MWDLNLLCLCRKIDTVSKDEMSNGRGVDAVCKSLGFCIRQETSLLNSDVSLCPPTDDTTRQEV